MSTNQYRGLRAVVITILVTLAIQFEFGMAINLSGPPSISPFSFSFPSVLNALNQIGFVGVVHAVLGTVLTIIAVVNLIMALASKMRGVQIFGALGFVSMVLAATMGVTFVLSGFQNDGYSHGMATNFLLTFVFHFLELYFLKPTGRTQAS
jgi:hypothetical protein